MTKSYLESLKEIVSTFNLAISSHSAGCHVRALKTFLVLIFLACAALPSLAQCNHHGQSMASDGYSKHFRRVCLGDDIGWNYFPSPDGQKILVADSHGFHLKISGAPVDWGDGQELLTTESEVLWSPTSSAFFVNDGYGINGWTLRVFTLVNNHVVSHDTINHDIVHKFRVKMKCLGSANNPNVRGIGWSRDGTKIFGFAQATVNDPCGEQGDLLGAVVSVNVSAVSSLFSEAELRKGFSSLLPFNMR